MNLADIFIPHFLEAQLSQLGVEVIEDEICVQPHNFETRQSPFISSLHGFMLMTLILTYRRSEKEGGSKARFW